MPENPGIDLIKGPVKLAAEMIAFQQEHIVRQLSGPEQTQRREMVGDVPLNDILAIVLPQMEVETL